MSDTVADGHYPQEPTTGASTDGVKIVSRSTEEREPEVPQEHMLNAIAEYTVHAPNCPFYEDGNCECAVEAFRETLRRVLVPSRLTAPSQEGEVVAWGWLVEVRQHGKWTVYPADMHNRAPLWRNEGLARCAAKDCADAGFEARVTPARLTPTQEPTEP